MAQETKNDFDKLFALIKDVDYCMLATVDAEGYLRSRPMATQKDYGDQELYFFTKRSSGKVVEIEHDASVNLAYASPEKQHYVSVSGRASLIEDKEKMQRLWNPAYKAWFPEGLEDPEVALVQVHIEKAEYWDSPSSTVVHLVGLAKAMLTGKPHHGGEHGTIENTMH